MTCVVLLSDENSSQKLKQFALHPLSVKGGQIASTAKIREDGHPEKMNGEHVKLL
jgi:hypothetical protein